MEINRSNTNHQTSSTNGASAKTDYGSVGWRALQEKLENNKGPELNNFSREIAEDLAMLVESNSGYITPNSRAKDLKSSR